ncbi:MAG: hypothetical protein C4557_00310 [Anaerolineaceae bacterium]|jgi:hypothetical protein|nr:MAG: hypothetical protein C4557_00310 [Anaerolineaceae bacterium]
MANKQASKWTDAQLAIAAIATTSVLAFWNMFAGVDKGKADQQAAEEQQTVVIPTATIETPPPTPEPTMPPIGYTILYGGEAPKPQVTVIRTNRGGGGGGGNEDDGGGGSASQPSTSTSSS